MFKISPTLMLDSYKVSQKFLMPPNTEFVYSNTTPRKSRIDGVTHVVNFGLQYFIKEYLIDRWQEDFFNMEEDEAVKQYVRIITCHLGPDVVAEKEVRSLHRLGYLPIRIKSLPEGDLVPMRVPVNTIVNTHKDFGWLTNYLETIMQCETWPAITLATLFREFKKVFNKYADLTSETRDMVPFQGHLFAMRGMSSLQSNISTGMAHLLSFVGTDTIPSLVGAEYYYNANIEEELLGVSVAASEHSQETAYFDEDHEDESAYIQAMLDAVPTGIVSVVCDGTDYWKFITETLPKFKDQIMARDGKFVCRADSGDQTLISCGYDCVTVNKTKDEFLDKLFTQTYQVKYFPTKYDCVKTSDGFYLDNRGDELQEYEVDGSLLTLYKVFGGQVNSKGYKVLDPHIGFIYGDGMNFERVNMILEKLVDKEISTENMVFGLGSYVAQMATSRDTFSIALKCTHTVIDGKPKDIFKDPKTDSGMKKSAKGLLRVDKIDGEYVLKDQCTPEEEQGGELKTVFENGKLLIDHTFSEIKDRLNNQCI